MDVILRNFMRVKMVIQDCIRFDAEWLTRGSFSTYLIYFYKWVVYIAPIHFICMSNGQASEASAILFSIVLQR